MYEMKMNLKPLLIFSLIVLSSVIFGIFSGFLEISLFADKLPIIEQPNDNIPIIEQPEEK